MANSTSALFAVCSHLRPLFTVLDTTSPFPTSQALYSISSFVKMGRLAEMQRKLLEVRCQFPKIPPSSSPRLQQMMGPEAMGVSNANLHWSDEKVCRNFLCGTCPHTLFTNTVSVLLLLTELPLIQLYRTENGPWRVP